MRIHLNTILRELNIELQKNIGLKPRGHQVTQENMKDELNIITRKLPKDFLNEKTNNYRKSIG
jgi:hypothetical protein